MKEIFHWQGDCHPEERCMDQQWDQEQEAGHQQRERKGKSSCQQMEEEEKEKDMFEGDDSDRSETGSD